MLLLLALAGCLRTSSGTQIAPVSGLVKYKGVPVKGVQVRFAQEGSAIVAGGVTDENGKFALTALKTDDGAAVGINRVTITAPRADVGERKAEIDAINSIADERERQAQKSGKRWQRAANNTRGPAAAPSQPSEERIPDKYSAADTSNLNFVVVAGKQNVCEFDLTD